MKNAVKKMKWAILAAGLVLGVGMALALRADIKYFWLDHPTGRTNPNDPLSPLYKSPTAVGPVGTRTDTPTITETATATVSPTPPGTLTDTPTATLTATVTQTPTETSTPEPGGWPDLFGVNGAQSVTVVASNIVTQGGTDGVAQDSGSGPGGSDFYADVTLSCAAGGYAAGVEFGQGFWGTSEPITQNAGAYASLSITVAIPPITADGGPATNPTLIVPAVNLVFQTTAGAFTTPTAAVNLDNFIVGGLNGTNGAQFMEESSSTTNLTWYTAVVPLYLFSELSNTNGVTPSAADLQEVAGVEVQPYNYGGTGAITTEVYVGSIIFTNATNPNWPATFSDAPAAWQGAPNAYSALFSDFENGTEDDWSGFWSTNYDGITSSTTYPTGTNNYGPCLYNGTDILVAPTYNGYGPITCGSTAPPYTSSNAPNADCWSVVSYDATTDTVASADTNGDGTPGYAAHLAGWLGSENGQYQGSGQSNEADCSTTAQEGANDYSYLNMTANTYPASATTQYVDLSTNNFIASLPSTGATGMSVDLLAGANNGSGQVYGIGIGTTTNSASAGNMWFFQVASSSLSTTQWTQFVVTFPADGTMGGSTSSSSQTTDSSSSYHTQGSTITELFFAQEEYSGYGAFSRNNVNQVEVESLLHNEAVDLYIDDIQFFSGTGPVVPASRHAAVRVVRGGAQ